MTLYCYDIVAIRLDTPRPHTPRLDDLSLPIRRAAEHWQKLVTSKKREEIKLLLWLAGVKHGAGDDRAVLLTLFNSHNEEREELKAEIARNALADAEWRAERVDQEARNLAAIAAFPGDVAAEVVVPGGPRGVNVLPQQGAPE